MDNKGFEIKLNNKLLCKAGFKKNHSVVHAIIGAVIRKDENEQELYLNISGLNSETKQQVKWFKTEDLNENDIISIKIIKGNFDAPKEVREEKSEAFLLAQKLKTFNRLKKELKDHL